MNLGELNLHPHAEAFFNWLLNRSLQAGVLVLLVIMVQALFRRQLTNRWRFALWWILLVRLLLPVGPESAVSIFNRVNLYVSLAGPRYDVGSLLAHPPGSVVPPQVIDLPAVPVHPAGGTAATSTGVGSATLAGSQAPVAGNGAGPVPDSLRARLSRGEDFGDWLVPTGLVLCWAAVAAAFGVLAALQTLRFRRKLSRSAKSADPALVELLEECRRDLRIKRRVELLEADAVASPALWGLLRLRVLLPRGMAVKFTRRELRHIFLHELAHVKRGDLWLNWLLTALQIMHWFNPLVWLGFARLRADRELACDELALLSAGETAGTAYGQTVIKLLEGLSRPRSVPGLIGILEDKKQMRRRISMLANFRRPGRWSALAVILLALVAAVALTDEQTGRSASSPAITTVAADAVHPDLTGAVYAKDGSPLAATVFIATAAPKVGTSTFCPSCYADCIKSAKSDAKGNYQITSLDPQLTFKVLAVATGYQPKYVSKVDPATGPVRITLDPIAAADAAPDRSLRGRVVNPKGEPIEGAVIQREGYRMKDGSGMWGAIDWIDPLAVTDEHGEFLITAKKPFDLLDVTVQARTYADKKFTGLACGRTKDLAVAEGATITGRVMAGGRPARNVVVGVAGVQREVSVWVGHFEVGTGTDGRFLLVNLPPDTDYYIYGLLDSTRPYGAIPIQTIHAGKDGETTDMGDLVTQPAHRLAGRVALADGSPVPANTRLLIGREQAWDTTQITLDSGGAFDTAGLPAETVSLSARVPGYRISSQNASLDPMNERLIGRVDRDITNLVFLLEKGPRIEPDYNSPTPQDQLPQNRPLHGVEGGVDHSHDWKISGRVLDRDTHQPIANFRVTPGQGDAMNRTNWDSAHGVDGNAGSYAAYVSRRFAQSLLKVDAEGYLPEVTSVPALDAINLDFALTRGSGPQGVVLSPDGTPAPDVNVVLLGSDANQVVFNSAGEFTAMYNRSAQQITDAAGHFAFRPEWGTRGIGAATSNGFALASLDPLATNLTLRLEPYGRITGILRRASGPATNEHLQLSVAQLSAGPRFNLSLQAVTDSDGRFAFDRVPPMHLTINDLVPMSGPSGSGGARMIQRLQDTTVQPGQTTQLTIETAENPAPAIWTPPPVPRRIPGASLKGTVLLPDGRPAADTQVALQTDVGWLSLRHGTFSSPQLAQNGMLVTTAPDGSFTLPLFDKTLFVAAISDDGFALMSLEQFQASPRIQLQKWGRIEGTLHTGHHVASNEMVQLMGVSNDGFVAQTSTVNDANAHSTTYTIVRAHDQETNNSTADLTNPVALQYDYDEFRVKTDAQGRFQFNLVPPGRQRVYRSVPIGSGSTAYPVGVVDVKPGETSKVTLGGNGRALTGRLNLGQSGPNDFVNVGFARIVPSALAALMERRAGLNTDEERRALDQSPEYPDAMRSGRSFPAIISPDGSFNADDVAPGAYRFFASGSGITSDSPTAFFSVRPLVVPEAKNQDDDSAVDLGVVELKKMTVPPPGTK